MEFANVLQPDTAAVLRAVGYGGQNADEKTTAAARQAAEDIKKAARPRWAYHCFPLEGKLVLAHTGVRLEGKSIAAHLAGCGSCYLLAVTLGDSVERLLRATQAVDMATAVLQDAAASGLVEQYADEAEGLLRKEAEAQGRFLTGRFSPGYGDLSLQLQGDMLRLLGAGKAIGLTATASGVLLPRKSITAILGLADHPVSGQAAGCGECSLAETCEFKKEGAACGRK